MKRLAFLLGAVMLTACLDTTGPNPSNPFNEVFDPSLGIDLTDPSWKITTNGTLFKDEVIGSGDSLVVQSASDTLNVTYNGWLKDGTLFDTGTNVPFQAGAVILGFVDGMVNMRTGGQRLIVIPSELGFGNASVTTNLTTVPRNSTLVFRVTLNSFKNVGL